MLINEHKFETILDNNRLIATRARKVLYQCLAGHNRPVTMRTLVTSLSGQVDRASVYRNVDIFEKIGIINKVYTGWKYRLELSEKFRPHHHHFTCTNCARIIPIELGNMLEYAITGVGKKKKLHITDHEIELRGLCEACQKSKTKRSSKKRGSRV